MPYFTKLFQRTALGVGLIVALLVSTLAPGQSAHAAQQPSSIELTSDSVDAHTGDTITFLAWVKCDGYTPTGTVTFYDGDTLLETVVAADGLASTAQAFASGSHLITAVYSGDEQCAASRQSLSQIVGGTINSFSFVLSVNPAAAGQLVTMTFTINCSYIIKGFVTFTSSNGFADTKAYPGNSKIGSVATSTSFSAGTYSITGKFTSSDNFCPNVNSTLSLNVFAGVVTQAFNPGCTVSYPVLGSVLVYRNMPQDVYDVANGNVVNDSTGTKVQIPNLQTTVQDSYEYTIMEKQTVNGKLWYGLFVGGCTPVWVPAANVTLKTFVVF